MRGAEVLGEELPVVVVFVEMCAGMERECRRENTTRGVIHIQERVSQGERYMPRTRKYVDRVVQCLRAPHLPHRPPSRPRWQQLVLKRRVRSWKVE